MKLVLENKNKLEIFIALFQLLKNWNSFLNIIFKKDKFYIQTMDKCHVCLAYINIDKSWFNYYELDDDKTDNNNSSDNESSIDNINEENQNKDEEDTDKDEEDIDKDEEDTDKDEDNKNSKQNNEMTITLDINNFSTILNYALKHDKLELIANINNPDYININLLNSENTKNSNYNHYFELPLMDVDIEKINIPNNIEYDVDFIINSKKFSEIIQELLVFDNTINITTNENEIELKSSGNNGKLNVKVPVDDLEEYIIAENETINMSYSLNHLNKMIISTKLTNNVFISLTNNFPMCVKYVIDQETNSNIIFFVAPKIED